jgi:dUTP pyrophosphatase
MSEKNLLNRPLMNRHLKIKIVNPVAHEYYQSDQMNYDSDSGFDLYVLEDILIKLGETKKIDLGIQCEMRSAYVPRGGNNDPQPTLPFYLYPRSSFSKTPLILANHVGIIDKDYRGNILAVVKFMPTRDIWEKFIRKKITYVCAASFDKTYTIKKGTRLFQICANDLMPFTYTIVDTLSDTQRGEKGLGSTGK